MKTRILTQAQLNLFLDHGHRGSLTISFTTMVLGTGDQTRNYPQMLIRNRGFMRPTGVVDCESCTNSRLNRILQTGPQGNWRDGQTVKDRHWKQYRDNPSVGLKLQCFYSAYLEFLQAVKVEYSSYKNPERFLMSQEGRAALIDVDPSDVLSVGEKVLAVENLSSDVMGIEFKSKNLHVLDLIDQLPLIPSKVALDQILNAPTSWHRRFHRLVDAIYPASWKEFPQHIVWAISAAGSIEIDQVPDAGVSRIPIAAILEEMCLSYAHVLKSVPNGVGDERISGAEATIVFKKMMNLTGGRVFPIIDTAEQEAIDKWVSDPDFSRGWNGLSRNPFLVGAAAQTPIPTAMMEDILRRLFQDDFDEMYQTTESKLASQ